MIRIIRTKRPEL